MTRALRSHHVWRLRRLEFKGGGGGGGGVHLWMCVMHVSSAGTSSVEGHSCLSMPFRIVCLSCRMCFLWSCSWSWACDHMTRHCVDSGGSGLILIFLFQRHGLCVVPFVTLPSVCSHFTWKDSWCERHTHHVRRGKSIANDAALAGRSHVAANAACRSSQRVTN